MIGLILAFIAGWLCCWWFAAWIFKNVLRHPEQARTKEAIGRLKQETLRGLSDVVNAELEKRRA